MHTKQHPPRRLWPWLLAQFALMALLLSACGGGNQPGINTAGVGSGGTGSTGTNSFANGPITAFGSIVVNGIHFDQSAATVTDGDDQPSTPAALQLGMVVEVDGGRISTVGQRTSAAASLIRLSSALLGPVDLVSQPQGTLTVMGQTVVVSAQTHFDSALPNGLIDVQAGDVVEVYGMHDAGSDTFVATRIERKTAPVSTYKVSGVVEDLDLVHNTCRIGQQQMVYAWPGQTTPMPANLANGVLVRGELYPSTSPSGQWWAMSMKVVTPVTAQDRDNASLSGVVTATTATSGVFSVNGTEVDARQAHCAPCTALHLGDKLLVKGRLTAGVVHATSVTALTEL